MKGFQKNLHSKTVKILAAVFMVGAVGGPTAIKRRSQNVPFHREIEQALAAWQKRGDKKSNYEDERESTVDVLEEEASTFDR